MKQKEKEKLKKLKKQGEIGKLRLKIRELERELTSALEEHGRAMVQRNHAEEFVQHFYDAIRRAIVMLKQ